MKAAPSPPVARTRLNGVGNLRDLEALGFVPSGPEGDPDALWGQCPGCSLRALKVEPRVPYTARCLRCGHVQPLTLPESPKRQLSDWLKPMAAIEAEVDPAADWLADRLLPTDGISLLVAPPKLGKSTAARCLAAAVAGGDSQWLGRPLSRHGPVVHLALEERPRTVLGHYSRLDADPARIHLLAGEPPPAGERISRLAAAVKDLEPVLVIIDPLQRWTRISDGNAYSETTEALTPLIDLARNGTHVMLIHHSRKSGGQHGEEALGSTAFAGSVDTILSMKRNGAARTIQAEGRDGAGMDETVLRLGSEGWITAAGTAAEASRSEKEGRVRGWLSEQAQPATLEEIRQGAGLGRTVAHDALKRLETHGAVQVSGEGKRGSPQRYSIAESLSVLSTAP